MKKKIIVTSIIIALIGVTILVGFNIYKTNKYKKEQLNQLSKSSEHIINIQPKDIFITKPIEFVQTIPITGLLKPIQEAQLKAKVSGDISLSLKVGDKVSKGQLIAHINNSDINSKLQQSSAQILIMQNQLNLAQNQYNRNAELAQQNFISKNSLDTFKTNLDIAKANLSSSISSHSINQKSLSDTKIFAPFNGIVSEQNIQNGEKTNIDSLIVKIVDISSLELEAGLSAEDINKVRLNQNVTLNLNNQEMQGRITRIAPVSNNSNRLINIYIKIHNKHNLKAGIYAKGHIILSKKTTTAIPNTSISKNFEGNYYINIINNDKLKSIKITPLEANNEYTKLNIQNNIQVVNIPLNEYSDKTKVVIK